MSEGDPYNLRIGIWPEELADPLSLPYISVFVTTFEMMLSTSGRSFSSSHLFGTFLLEETSPQYLALQDRNLRLRDLTKRE